MPIRNSRRALLPAVFVTCASVATACSPAVKVPPRASASSSSEIRPLVAGKGVDGSLRPGERRTFEVRVPAARVVLGTIEQHGIDLEVRVFDEGGVLVASLDSPNGPEGPEPFTLEGKARDTVFRLEVHGLEEQSSTEGRYLARIDQTRTVEAHAEALAAERWESPRLLRLWKDHRGRGAAALDAFAAELKGRAPLVEPIPGDARGDLLLTFVRRGEPPKGQVSVLGGPTDMEADLAPMTRFEGSDLFVLSVRVPKDARFTYGFVPGAVPMPGASPKRRTASFTLPEADPWNPRSFPGGPSLFALPGAPSQASAEPKEGVPRGRIVARSLKSDVLHEERPVSVYLPPSFDAKGGPYPYVVLLDGEAFGSQPHALVPTPTIMDNLIAAGKVPPTIVVLVDNVDRTRDLTMSEPFGSFLAEELAPWVRREYRGTADPRRVIVGGASFGGLSAVHTALHHSDVFGNALSQSGSFWFSPGAMEASSPFAVDTGALMKEVLAMPTRPVRVWMEVGIFEGPADIAGGHQVAQNRHMRDLLKAKGYAVTYREYAGGHYYACWRGSLADGLRDLSVSP